MERNLQTLELLLICPRCGASFTWTSTDFEDLAVCPTCGHTNEAWFFWHTTNPVTIITYKNGVRCEVFSYGAHYTNDALQLERHEFIEELLWFPYKGHGGGPYMWIYRWWYGSGNPNNGMLSYKVVIDSYISSAKEADDQLKHVAQILVTGLKAVSRGGLSYGGGMP